MPTPSASSLASLSSTALPRPTPEYPDLDAAWPTAGPLASGQAPYVLVSATFDALDRTRSRLLITGILEYLFRYVAARAPTALEATVFLCTNRVVPAFVPFELGIGGQVIGGAVGDISGRSAAQLRADYNRLGDMGDVAQEARAGARLITSAFGAGSPGPRAVLSIAGVHQALLELGGVRGAQSVERKRARVRALLLQARDTETRWLVRTFLGNLRVGAVEKTVVTALAQAFAPTGSAAEAALQLSACYSRRPDYRHMVRTLLAGGVPAVVAACDVTAGTPLVPMLGQIARYA